MLYGIVVPKSSSRWLGNSTWLQLAPHFIRNLYRDNIIPQTLLLSLPHNHWIVNQIWINIYNGYILYWLRFDISKSFSNISSGNQTWLAGQSPNRFWRFLALGISLISMVHGFQQAMSNSPGHQHAPHQVGNGWPISVQLRLPGPGSSSPTVTFMVVFETRASPNIWIV